MRDFERFWAKVDASRGPGECWTWTASRFGYGHGRFVAGGRHWGAHRWLMNSLSSVPLTKSEHVCHKCDNPPCVNPAHLYIGSYGTNVADRERRGRSGSGSVNARKTHCPAGHAYAGSNVAVKNGSRNCRACAADWARARRALVGGGG